MTHRLRGRAAALATLACLWGATQPATARAQEAPAATEAAVSAPAAPAPLSLTLDEAVDLALEQAFGLRVARNDLASSQAGVRAAINEFDFKLTTSFDAGQAFQRNREFYDLAGDPLYRDGVADSQQFAFVLAKELRMGGSVELRTDLTRFRTPEGPEDPIPDPGIEIFPNPIHRASSSVAWTIPLWGGRGRRVATAGLVSAETSLRQQARGLIEREMQVVVEVVRSFYQVLRTQSVLHIDRQAMDRAEENYRTYQLRLEEGLVTPIDVSRSERELKGRQNAVVADEESLQGARDQLLQLLALPLDTPLEITGEPVFARADVELAAATDEAMKNRADLRAQREAVELSRLDRDVARSNTKPQVDLTLSAGVDAVGGGEANKWFDADDDDTWAGGVSLAYTFGERADDEAFMQAIIAEDSSKIRLEELQRQVVLEVRDAVRNVRSLERQVALLEDNVTLAQESLRLAQLQLEEDLIGTTDLLQIQDELVRAETDRVNALYDHATARVNLDLALGRYRVGTSRRSQYLQDAPSVEPDVPVLPRARLEGEAP